MSASGACMPRVSRRRTSIHGCRGFGIAGSFAVLLAAPLTHAQQARSEHGDFVEDALVSRGIELGHPRSRVIVAWNSLAHDIAFAEDQFLTFKGQRALAMMHLAMHDALNAIVPVYEDE